MNDKLVPNSAQIPNVLLDYVLPLLGEAEMKCLLYIARRTYGFHKDFDRISLSQFEDGLIGKDGKPLDHGAGVTRKNAMLALARLKEKLLIKVSTNQLGSTYEIDLDSSLIWSVLESERPQSQDDSTPSVGTTPRVESERHPQKKGKKEGEKRPSKEGEQAPSFGSLRSLAAEEAPPQTFGRPDINDVLGYLKASVPVVDGSQRENRRFASLMIDKMAKNAKDPTRAVDAVKFVIAKGLESAFHGRNLTSMKYVFYNAGKILAEASKPTTGKFGFAEKLAFNK